MKNKIKKLRILFIAIDKYPLFRVDMSVLFGKEIISRGHMINWLLQSEKTIFKGYDTVWNGCDVHVGPMDARRKISAKVRKNVFNLIFDINITKYVFSKKYDLVQVKDKIFAALIAIVLCKIIKTKMIFWLSYPFPEHYLNEANLVSAPYRIIYKIKGNILKFVLYHIVLQLSDHCFVQSKKMKDDLERRGINGTKMTVVPMGIDKQKILKAKSVGIREKRFQEPTVVYTGIFFKARKLEFIIRMIDYVKESYPNVKLYMIGKGNDDEDENRLKREVERLNLKDNVIFTGFIPFDEMLNYIIRADVCVSPYYPAFILNSTSPTKLIEYMALGKPVVATHHPEQSYIIKESGAGICVPYNEKEFSMAVIKLLKSPELCKIMGVRGQKYVLRKRNYKKIAEIVEKVYFRTIYT